MSRIIIYDDTCPMCRWYTNEFTKYGLLEKDNRLCFKDLKNHEQLRGCIDADRARHEIPLVDPMTGDVIYGFDSLVFLLNKKWKIVGWGAQIKPIRWFFKKLYNLVTYNRRVIAPSVETDYYRQFAPDFNVFYRTIYLVFAFSVGLFLLLKMHEIFGITTFFFMMLMFLTGFIFKLKTRFNFWGQWATVTLIGGLLMLPALFFKSEMMILMLLPVFMMIKEAYRRMNIIL